MPFKHGITVTEIDTGARTLTAVSTAIIGLVATASDADADVFPLDRPALITDIEAATRFADDTRKYQEAQTRLAALRDQLEATEKPTKKLRDEFARTEKQAAALTARLDSNGAELQQLAGKLSAAGFDVGELAAHEDRLAQRTAEANQALQSHRRLLCDEGREKVGVIRPFRSAAPTTSLRSILSSSSRNAAICGFRSPR